MTNITSNELEVLRAFPICDDDYNHVASDLGQTWTEVKELAEETGKTVASVRATIGSLMKKGMIYSEEKPNGQRGEIQCLSEAACEYLASLETEDDDIIEETEDAAEFEDDILVEDSVNADGFRAAFNAAGGFQPRGICAAFRSVAKEWKGSRKEFIAAAVANDLDAGTAATQWQKGRA